MPDVYAPPEANLSAPIAYAIDSALGVYPPEVGALLRRSVDLLKDNALPLVLGVAALMIVNLAINVPLSMIPNLLPLLVGPDAGDAAQVAVAGVSFLVQLLAMAVQFFTTGYFSLGLAGASLVLVRTGSVGLSDFFPRDLRLIGRGALAAVIVGIATMVGTCLFIVPGIVLAMGLILWPMVMMTQDCGPVEACQRSWDLSRGHKMNLFLWAIVTSLITMVAALFTCGFGALATMPLWGIGNALAFEGIRGNEAQLAGT